MSSQAYEFHNLCRVRNITVNTSCAGARQRNGEASACGLDHEIGPMDQPACPQTLSSWKISLPVLHNPGRRGARGLAPSSRCTPTGGVQKNTEASRRFWHTVFINYHLMFRSGSQQRVVNSVLLTHAGRSLTVDILPEKEFANGHLFKPTDASRLPPDAYVIHCSWTGNAGDKIKKYKNANLWYLDGDTRSAI